jgi:molecular chaperone HtpG
MATHAFQTEVQQLLHLMIHSLYSDREIFLRELISNASDACDKLRFNALTNAKLMVGDDRLQVDITADPEGKTLVITDTGIGLTEAEAIEHLGTIAKSGTKQFLQAMGEAGKSSNLIGQFGVGFYSAFMVADRIVVESRSATVDSDHGVRWESAGDGNFATETISRGQRGTTVTLHLKDDAKDFAETWKLRELVKKYSDYVSYPVMLPKYVSDEDKAKGVKPEPEQVNAGQALWTRPKDQISDTEYTEFYKSACKQWDEPATRLHVVVEGTLSFSTLLFIPSEKPHDLFDRDRRGLSLYVRRVFIMDDCKDLLPEYLRFVRGVVDSDDLPLNVSREILQQQDTVAKLRKQLVKRILDHFAKLAASSEEADKTAFAKVDAAFGPILREGLVNDFENKDKIQRLARYATTKTEGETKVGFEGYVARMAEGQPAIYYVTAANVAAAKSSPHLEGFAKRGYEVLFMVDPVDEWVAGHVTEFDGKKLVSVAKGSEDLGTDAEKKDLEEKTKELGGFITFVKDALGDEVGEVRLSHRLTDSPCCLVGEEHSTSPQMEELMRKMGQPIPASKRILELNPGHPLVNKLQTLQGTDADKAKVHVRVLRDQALLAEGGRIADPASFAKRVQELLLNA